MQQTWFITGSSRGFGRALVRAALQAGDSVAATARQPGQLDDLVAEFGDRIKPIALDVTDAAAARAAIAAAREHFGRLDVIVNNAGYANVSPIETTADEDFREQFETNFWGVYNVSKAAIPVLREQGGGLIMQFSSVGGRVGGSPGIASYQAAKFAIDGFSRVLQAETAPFGVRVIVVEPSGFRDGLGRLLDDHPGHPGGLRHDRRGHQHAHPAEPGRPARRPGARGRHPGAGGPAPGYPVSPAARGDRGRGIDPARRAAPGAGPPVARGEPVRGLR